MRTEREKAAVGLRVLKEPGSVPWAWQTLNALRSKWKLRNLSIKGFESIIDELKEYKAWEVVPPENPYGSLDAMLQAEIGCLEEQAREEVRLQDHGGDRKSEEFKNENQGANSTLKRGSTSSTYLLARLKRDFPDIAEGLARGEYKSARAAAIKAGIIKDPTPLDLLQRAWNKASKKEQSEFLSWIKTNR